MVSITEDELNARLHKAWREGFDAGEQDVFMHDEADDWDLPCIQNPYPAGETHEIP